MSSLNPDDLLEYLYEEITTFLVKEAGEELGHNEIDITLKSTEKGEINIEISLVIELTAFSNINAEELSKKAISYAEVIADKHCPPLVKLQVSERKNSQ